MLEKSEKKLNILLLGKRHAVSGNHKSGGVIIPFEQMLVDLRDFPVNQTIIDNNFRNYKSKIHAYLSVLSGIMANIRKSDLVFVNGSNEIVHQYGILLCVLNLFFRRPVFYRLLGGNQVGYIESRPWPVRKLVLWTLDRSTALLFETKRSVKAFSYLRSKTIWYPNVRVKMPLTTDLAYQKRFVFLGHVKTEKGVDVLLRAINQISQTNDDYTFDIYGPEVDYQSPESLRDVYSKHYKGAIGPEKVNETLASYDVLLMPTLYKNEGYPGVIVEAFNAGLPVMATPLGGIPEMVDSECGWLIEEGSVDDLVKTILSIDEEKYLLLRKESRKRFDAYDSVKVLENVFEEMRSATNREAH